MGLFSTHEPSTHNLNKSVLVMNTFLVCKPFVCVNVFTVFLHIFILGLLFWTHCTLKHIQVLVLTGKFARIKNTFGLECVIVLPEERAIGKCSEIVSESKRQFETEKQCQCERKCLKVREGVWKSSVWSERLKLKKQYLKLKVCEGERRCVKRKNNNLWNCESVKVTEGFLMRGKVWNWDRESGCSFQEMRPTLPPSSYR